MLERSAYLEKDSKAFADHTPGDILVSSMHVLSEFAWSKVLVTVFVFHHSSKRKFHLKQSLVLFRSY